MRAELEGAKEFCKHHLPRMNELRELIKKWAERKDEYIIENSTFVTDQICIFEEFCLQGAAASQATV